MRLVPALVCLLAVTAGCAMPLGGSATTTPAGSDSPTASSMAQPPTCTPVDRTMTAYLKVRVETEHPVNLTISYLENDTVVVSETLDPDEVAEFGEEHGDRHADSRLAPATDYRARVSASGTVLWSQRMNLNREFAILITEDGDVRETRAYIIESPTPCPG